MKKIAIITSGFAPVPDLKGGAVEMLTTYLIDGNESDKKYIFDVYTIHDEQLKNLNLKNTNIIQIKVKNWEKFVERVINKGLRVAKLKKQIAIYNYKLCQLLKKKKVKYDYILFENSMDLFSSVEKIYGNKSQYLVHLHNDLNPVSKSVDMAVEVANHAKKIIGVSEFIKQRFIKSTHCEEEKCDVLYNCIEKKSFHVDELYRKALREKMGYKENDYVFLYVGRINEEKGTRELAEAFGKIDSSDAKLIICGGTWGTEFRKNRYLDEVEKGVLLKKKDTLFTGYIEKEKMDDYYMVADAVVIPSICEEAFGMVMLEAAMRGKPIIATKSGGMQEILSQQEAFWVSKDLTIVDEIKDAMNLFMENRERTVEMGKLAQKHVLDATYFDRNTYFTRFVDIIEK